MRLRRTRRCVLAVAPVLRLSRAVPEEEAVHMQRRDSHLLLLLLLLLLVFYRDRAAPVLCTWLLLLLLLLLLAGGRACEGLRAVSARVAARAGSHWLRWGHGRGRQRELHPDQDVGGFHLQVHFIISTTTSSSKGKEVRRCLVSSISTQVCLGVRAHFASARHIAFPYWGQSMDEAFPYWSIDEAFPYWSIDEAFPYWSMDEAFPYWSMDEAFPYWSMDEAFSYWSMDEAFPCWSMDEAFPNWSMDEAFPC